MSAYMQMILGKIKMNTWRIRFRPHASGGLHGTRGTEARHACGGRTARVGQMDGARAVEAGL